MPRKPLNRKPNKLEEYEPGATKEEVLASLSRAARTSKPPEDEPKTGYAKKPQK